MLRHTTRLLAAVLLAGVPLAGCQKNAATGRSQFLLFGLTPDQELALGAEAAPQFTAEYGGAVPDPAVNNYVTSIGAALAATTEADNPELPWEFTLLDSDVINAFSLPGGKVFISRALAEEMTDEAQLAAVLGHEIGHVTARHTSERLSKANAFQLGLATVVAATSKDTDNKWVQLGVPALNVGGQLVLLQFSRDQELEADALGLRYMVNNHYDPAGALAVQQILLEQSGPGGGLDAFLSTHPHPEDRIAQIKRLIATTYAYTQNNPDYQLFPGRFNRLFLSRLSALPPAKHDPPLPTAFALDDPTTWCAHCRAEH